MESQQTGKRWVYIIDDDFRVVYADGGTPEAKEALLSARHCYQVICKRDSQCESCPLRVEDHAPGLLFDQLRQTWVSAKASEIQWPGAGRCHVLLCDSTQAAVRACFDRGGEAALPLLTAPQAQDAPAARSLYDRQDFFRHAATLLRQSGDGRQWSLLAIDLEKFKLFNEWYGLEAGDLLLGAVAACLGDLMASGKGLAGCFGDDDFAFLMPRSEERTQAVCSVITQELRRHCGKMNVLPAFGVYHVTDPAEPVYQMYDRALLACAAVKGSYATRVRYFDPKMLEAMESELLLLADIQRAFEDREFTFHLQPKCDMRTGKIVGAEALARWQSREKGMVSPGVFIPFLEKAGLVSELDTFLWEEVCRWQRSMLDRGRPTVPVSVNISRVDICSVDVPACFTGLIRKYGLDPALIELEITESVYAEDITAINKIVTALRAAGFRVLMDDFGSAYSSLNMLKELPLDVIKMDMKFLHWSGSNAGRAADILDTVCNMAHILGLGIVAEGVETPEQRDFLLRSGCSCGQGYLFYRPLPIGDFEETIADPEKLGQEAFDQEPMELFNPKDLLNKNLLSQDMLGHMLGAVAFYDVCGDRITVLRYNEQYAAILGNKTNEAETEVVFGEQLYQEDREQILRMFADAQEKRRTGAETDLRRRRPDGTDMWIHLRVFFLYQRDGHAVYYSTVSDVTELRRTNEVLRFLNNDMPGGYYRHRNTPDGEFTHISQRFLDMFGYTREEIRQEFDDKFINMVHPEDRETVVSSMAAMGQTGGNYSQPCRMRSKNGYILVVDQSRLVRYGGQEVFQGILLTDLDHYAWLKDDAGDAGGQDDATTTLMPCGVFRSEADGAHQFTYISNSMLHMLGYSRQAFLKKFHNTVENMVYWADRRRVTEEIASQVRTGSFTACEFRVELADGSFKWVYSRGRLTTDRSGKRWFYVCITDYDYLKRKYQVQEWQLLKYRSLLEIPGLLVYDLDPISDRLTVEMTLEDGRRETVVLEKYVAELASHGLIAPSCVDTQRDLLRSATSRPTSGSTEFLGRFRRDQDYQWYRFHYISLADESGRVNRVVGRGETVPSSEEE